jgi:hypothetical protein
MLNNGIKETTATAGTGTVTLTAVTGFARFADGFTNGSLASYAIRDGNNWEWGVGTVGAANTLARTAITGSLVAGTFTTGGTAITLASGAASVFIADHSGTTRPASAIVNLSGTNTGDQTITLTGGVTGSGTGSFAATVITNANLTGPVTSTGNATAIANGAISNAMLANGAVANLSGTNTGDQKSIDGITGTIAQFNTAITDGDLATGGGTATGTNTGDQTITLTGGVTGSGTGSFAATVVTNANLTGGVTSVGNAATVITNANLTGQVTSIGNATAIADKAIALAKLADGTAGNVITYSAAGVIAVVATGTSGQVLTSNGAGTAPTMQNAVAASASAPVFEQTFLLMGA